MKPNCYFVALLVIAGCSTTPTALDQWSEFTRSADAMGEVQRQQAYNRARDQYGEHPGDLGRLQLAYLQTGVGASPESLAQARELLLQVGGEGGLDTVRDSLRREIALLERLADEKTEFDKVQRAADGARERVLTLQWQLEKVHSDLDTCRTQLEALKNIESDMSEENNPLNTLQQ